MPWKETSSMSERVKWVAAMLEAEETLGEICERFGISRKQGCTWKERYEKGGVQALVDRSRAPHSHPQAVPAEVRRRAPAVRSSRSSARLGRGSVCAAVTASAATC